MIEYWKKESPEAWLHFRNAGAKDMQGNSISPASDKFMLNFHEKHIPISESTLTQWQKEVDNSSYGQSLKSDIKWAKRCNERQDEVLLFRK